MHGLSMYNSLSRSTSAVYLFFLIFFLMPVSLGVRDALLGNVPLPVTVY
jgi:hypothetical protein